jgi:hypothetical protein
MALLDETNLAAERARHAKFRTNHVGTKLNEAELREFEALTEKRKQTPSGRIEGHDTCFWYSFAHGTSCANGGSWAYAAGQPARGHLL